MIGIKKLDPFLGKNFIKYFNVFLDSPHAFKKQQQLAAHAWSIKVVDFLNIMYNLQYNMKTRFLAEQFSVEVIFSTIGWNLFWMIMHFLKKIIHI